MSIRLAFFVVAFAFPAIDGHAQSIVSQDRSVRDCRNESILLSIWETQGVIGKVIYSEGRAEVKVSFRGWHKVSRQVHASIGLAAFCRIAGPDGKGVVEVTNGAVIGTVIDGQWRDLLYGN